MTTNNYNANAPYGLDKMKRNLSDWNTFIDGREADGYHEDSVSLILKIGNKNETTIVDDGEYLSILVDTRKLDNPILKRIVLGLGGSLTYYGPLVYQDRQNKILAYTKWDKPTPKETSELYIQRHFKKMNIEKIISLPTEPSFMQVDVGRRWAYKLGILTSVNTMKKYLKKHGVMICGVKHVHTSNFFDHLCTQQVSE